MLNKIFHQSIRTEIMAIIFSNDETSFKILKDKLDVTFGNLFIHLEKLEKAGYIQSFKQTKNARSYTTYKTTKNGMEEFYEYMSEIEKILKDLHKIRSIK